MIPLWLSMMISTPACVTDEALDPALRPHVIAEMIEEVQEVALTPHQASALCADLLRRFEREAYLPAQSYPPPPQARFSRPYGDEGRPEGPLSPSREGPQAARRQHLQEVKLREPAALSRR